MLFHTHVEAHQIHCKIIPDRDLERPVFCFSCMLPCLSADGYERLKNMGGYNEIQLPDLISDQAFDFVILYESVGDSMPFAPPNRAWLPLGAYLRTGEKIITLPPLQPAGVKIGMISYNPGCEPDYLICPQPTSFKMTNNIADVKSLRSDSEHTKSADLLAQRCGFGKLLAPDGIPLDIEIDTSLPCEAYKLVIEQKRIKLIHNDASGAFYGSITLATLIANHNGRVPCGFINDNPRFEWRGQHLDCARHFYQVDTILRLLDLMALLKLNRFHWHFADDEAFRLVLDSLPDIAQTHFRGENEFVPGVYGGGARAGGCYSRADAELIIAHAKALHIDVMPEIEVPAHALALCMVYPASRDKHDKGTEQSVQNYANNVMNPAMNESWRIWKSMVSEISGIFPFDVMHLGGDELPHDTWQGSPAAKELMQREGLNTTQDLQGWTMNKLAQYTQSCGKTPAGWEESSLGNPTIGKEAIIFSWTGQGAGLQAARDGYQVVMMPGQKTYLDMAQSDAFDDWGANWAAVISLEETINWDPVPDEEPELEKQILGVEGAFWSEFTTIDAQMEPMLAPRILGVATMAWQTRGSASSDILLGLRRAYLKRFEAMSWKVS